MNKKLLKTLTGLAIVGTALGAAFLYSHIIISILIHFALKEKDYF